MELEAVVAAADLGSLHRFGFPCCKLCILYYKVEETHGDVVRDGNMRDGFLLAVLIVIIMSIFIL